MKRSRYDKQRLMKEGPSSTGVTLRDIAKSLNISHVTVSLALRNAPQISESRRTQIHEAARQMGYRPNPMAAALGHMRSAGRAQPVSAGLAWINHWTVPSDLHRFKEFDLYWKGARDTASWYGYNLEEFVCDSSFSLARLEKVLLARNVNGILIPPHNSLPPGWDNFPWNHFSVVRFGHSILRPKVHVVTSDQITNSLVAFEKIRELGYQRIGHVTSLATRTRVKAGFLMAQFPLPVKQRLPILVLQSGEDNSDNKKKLFQWLDKNKPDAILTEIAIVPDLLKEAGYNVPKDIGLAALSIHDGNADTGIDQKPEEIGKAAVEMLISLINHNHVGIPKICRELLIEGEWVTGTTMPRRSHPAPSSKAKSTR